MRSCRPCLISLLERVGRAPEQALGICDLRAHADRAEPGQNSEPPPSRPATIELPSATRLGGGCRFDSRLSISSAPLPGCRAGRFRRLYRGACSPAGQLARRAPGTPTSSLQGRTGGCLATHRVDLDLRGRMTPADPSGASNGCRPPVGHPPLAVPSLRRTGPFPRPAGAAGRPLRAGAGRPSRPTLRSTGTGSSGPSDQATAPTE